MDQHHATVWTGVVAALLTATALVFTVSDSRVYQRLGIASGVAALYVLLSFFVPLPLIKTWTQRAADRVLDHPSVFRVRLAAFERKGESLLGQRNAGLFDEGTQEEEESDWAWSVVVFLEDSIGKAAALDFEETVLTFKPPPFFITGTPAKYDTDLETGIANLSGLLSRADEVALRPGFDAPKWSVG